MDDTLFVYRHITDDKIRVCGLVNARAFEENENYKHIGTINPRAWIESKLNDNKALVVEMELL